MIMPRYDAFVTRRIPDAALDILRQVASVRVWPDDDVPPPPAALRREAAAADALLCLLTDQVDGDLLDAAPRLAVVANMAVGYDNVDVAAATSRGVPVTNTPGVLTETTADLAFALILAAARRVAEGDALVRAGGWRSWGPMLLLGQDVHGAALGIVGMGRIGRAVAARGRGFSMRILYADEERRPGVEAELGAQYCSLQELLRRSDFVSVHVPLTAATRGLIGAAELALMKPTAILVNSARGPIVDEAALVAALRAGRPGGAALDVMEREPVGPGHPLLSAPGVLLTPHIGSASVATRTLMATMAAQNVAAVLAGARPPNLVNPEAWERRRRPGGA